MRKGSDREKEEEVVKKNGDNWQKRSTDVVARRPPEWRPNSTPTLVPEAFIPAPKLQCYISFVPRGIPMLLGD